MAFYGVALDYFTDATLTLEFQIAQVKAALEALWAQYLRLGRDRPTGYADYQLRGWHRFYIQMYHDEYRRLTNRLKELHDEPYGEETICDCILCWPRRLYFPPIEDEAWDYLRQKWVRNIRTPDEEARQAGVPPPREGNQPPPCQEAGNMPIHPQPPAYPEPAFPPHYQPPAHLEPPRVAPNYGPPPMYPGPMQPPNHHQTPAARPNPAIYYPQPPSYGYQTPTAPLNSTPQAVDLRQRMEEENGEPSFPLAPLLALACRPLRTINWHDLHPDVQTSEEGSEVPQQPPNPEERQEPPGSAESDNNMETDAAAPTPVNQSPELLQIGEEAGNRTPPPPYSQDDINMGYEEREAPGPSRRHWKVRRVPGHPFNLTIRVDRKGSPPPSPRSRK